MRTKDKIQERRNTGKNRQINEKNAKYRQGNREAMRQTQRERYKRDKDKINAK